MGGIGTYSIGVISIPPHAEEQVEWYSQGERSDELRIVVDRKVCRFAEVSVLRLNGLVVPGSSGH